MELNFIKCGDYYIPDIKLKNPNIRLGKWGRMRKEYLRLANPVLFSDMVLNETLYEHCAEIRRVCGKAFCLQHEPSRVYPASHNRGSHTPHHNRVPRQ